MDGAAPRSRPAARLRIVDESCPQAELLDRSVGRVSSLAEKDRATYAALKRGLYERALQVIAAEGASGRGSRGLAGCAIILRAESGPSRGAP